MATGARPERISGKPREACSATSAKSHTIARPKPKPNALPWTSAMLINGEDLRAALNLMIRADSPRIAAGVRPARSRPVQKTCPRARVRRTRARGLEASLRSSASMASNIAPVTSLPWLELSNVKVRTSALRSMATPLPVVGLEATLGFLLVMAGTVYKECRPVKWRGNCLQGMSESVFFEFRSGRKNAGGLSGNVRLPSSVVGQRMAERRDWNSREKPYPTLSLAGKCYAVDSLSA